jgi:hypothetical protein
MPKNQTAVIPALTQQFAKYPAWTVLPQQPVTDIQADHRVETDIDVNGVGRVRVKPGYNINIGEIRYKY